MSPSASRASAATGTAGTAGTAGKASIVGGGIMGLCAAWALARRGWRVSLFEQGPLPNPLASSTDQHRLIRHPYGAADGYVRMVSAAFGAWDRVWQSLGQCLYVETGTLVLSHDPDGGGWAARSRASLERCGIASNWLDVGETLARWPLLASEGIHGALYLTGGGILRAEDIQRALIAHLPALGVTFHPATPVASIDAAGGRLILADGGAVDADLLVVAAGPWVGRLLPDMAARVTPSRQVVTYLTPPLQWESAWETAPMVLTIGDDSGFYAVPPVAGLGLKVGDHSFSLVGEPDRDRVASPAEAAAVARLAGRHLRDFSAYRLVEAKTCFYDVAAEERFILEPLGPAAWVMSGFSGHGFKFAPLLAERLAAAAAGDITAAALGHWAAGLAEIAP